MSVSSIHRRNNDTTARGIDTLHEYGNRRSIRHDNRIDVVVARTAGTAVGIRAPCSAAWNRKQRITLHEDLALGNHVVDEVGVEAVRVVRIAGAVVRCSFGGERGL